MNVTCPSLIVKIKNLMTEDWPNRIIYKVIGILNEKYHPAYITSKVRQKREFMALKLKGRKDPENF